MCNYSIIQDKNITCYGWSEWFWVGLEWVGMDLVRVNLGRVGTWSGGN